MKYNKKFLTALLIFATAVAAVVIIYRSKHPTGDLGGTYLESGRRQTEFIPRGGITLANIPAAFPNLIK